MTKKLPDDPVAALLERLERWLSQNRKNYARRLPPGATEAELRDLEKHFGKPLPSALHSLLAWHNGQGDEFIGAFEEDWLLMSTAAITATRNDLLQDPAAGWQKSWIPFLDNDAGDFMFVDTSQAGEPVRVYSLGEKQHPQVAPSLAEWLRAFVENVDKGNYVEEPERGRFLRRGPA